MADQIIRRNLILFWDMGRVEAAARKPEAEEIKTWL